MSLKGHIPESEWRRLIKTGIISCAVDNHDQILDCVQRKKTMGISHTEAVIQTAIEMKVSEQWVYRLIKRYQ